MSLTLHVAEGKPTRIEQFAEKAASCRGRSRGRGGGRGRGKGKGKGKSSKKEPAKQRGRGGRGRGRGRGCGLQETAEGDLTTPTRKPQDDEEPETGPKVSPNALRRSQMAPEAEQTEPANSKKATAKVQSKTPKSKGQKAAAKAKAKAKPKAKSSSKKKTAKAKATPKKGPRASAKAGSNPNGSKRKHGSEKQTGKEKSFARRWRPAPSAASWQWQCIRDTFNMYVREHVSFPSKLEDRIAQIACS